MRRFVAVDLETTGLDPTEDYIIEVGVCGERLDGGYFETHFSLSFPEERMSSEAAAINGWGKRPFPQKQTDMRAAGQLSMLLDNVHIVGKNPQFDVGFLGFLFQFCGVKPTWHYRLVDVGTLAWGYYQHMAYRSNVFIEPQPPNVDRVAEMVGIPRETVEGQDGKQYHTALGDAKWAWEVFRKIVPAPER